MSSPLNPGADLTARNQRAVVNDSTDHYQVASAIMALKHTLNCSRKTWDLAVQLIAAEADRNKSQWKATATTKVAEPSQSRETRNPSNVQTVRRAKKPDVIPPSINKAKLTPEYKLLELRQKSIRETYKGLSSKSALTPDQESARASEMSKVEKEMFTMRHSKDPASGEVSLPFAMRSGDEKSPGVKPPEIPAAALRGPLSAFTIKELLRGSFIPGMMTVVQWNTIATNVRNGTLADSAEILGAWYAARKYYTQNAC